MIVLAFTLSLLATTSADVRSEALSKHNAYRARHSAPALRWDTGAAAHAQQHCNYLARTGRFSHSKSRYGKLSQFAPRPNISF